MLGRHRGGATTRRPRLYSCRRPGSCARVQMAGLLAAPPPSSSFFFPPPRVPGPWFSLFFFFFFQNAALAEALASFSGFRSFRIVLPLQRWPHFRASARSESCSRCSAGVISSAMPRHAMQCYVVFRCAMPRLQLQCYDMQCVTTQCYAMLCHATL